MVISRKGLSPNFSKNNGWLKALTALSYFGTSEISALQYIGCLWHTLCRITEEKCVCSGAGLASRLIKTSG